MALTVRAPSIIRDLQVMQAQLRYVGRRAQSTSASTGYVAIDGGTFTVTPHTPIVLAGGDYVGGATPHAPIGGVVTGGGGTPSDVYGDIYADIY